MPTSTATRTLQNDDLYLVTRGGCDLGHLAAVRQVDDLAGSRQLRQPGKGPLDDLVGLAGEGVVDHDGQATLGLHPPRQDLLDRGRRPPPLPLGLEQGIQLVETGELLVEL